MISPARAMSACRAAGYNAGSEWLDLSHMSPGAVAAYLDHVHHFSPGQHLPGFTPRARYLRGDLRAKAINRAEIMIAESERLASLFASDDQDDFVKACWMAFKQAEAIGTELCRETACTNAIRHRISSARVLDGMINKGEPITREDRNGPHLTPATRSPGAWKTRSDAVRFLYAVYALGHVTEIHKLTVSPCADIRSALIDAGGSDCPVKAFREGFSDKLRRELHRRGIARERHVLAFVVEGVSKDRHTRCLRGPAAVHLHGVMCIRQDEREAFRAALGATVHGTGVGVAKRSAIRLAPFDPANGEELPYYLAPGFSQHSDTRSAVFMSQPATRAAKALYGADVTAFRSRDLTYKRPA